MKTITVTAAIIENENNEVLICKRAVGSSMGGLWEFPGGKLEENETYEECVVRECKEELEVEICPIGIFAKTEYQYPDRYIKFTFFNAKIQSGMPKKNVHDDIRWVKYGELNSFEFCPADMEIIEKLIQQRG